MTSKTQSIAQNATIGPNNDPAGPDWFLVNNDPSINYAPTMAKLVNNVLTPDGLPVVYDDTSQFISTAPGPVIGYDTQGMHQASTPPNYLTNGLNITLANGAVFNSWESYNAYSFTPGGYTGTQGQVAQWLAIGGTAGVGNVQEPGASTSTVANEDQMFQMLLSGKTWAEAAWSWFAQLGFVNTVVGDPLMTWTSAPLVILNNPTSGNTRPWSTVTGPANIANPTTAIISDAESAHLTSMTISLANPQPGDLLNANTAGTNIAQSFNNGVLSLTGSDLVANYQTVLRSVTYNNTQGGPGTTSVSITVTANDGVQSSVPVTATINILPYVLEPDSQNAALVNLVWGGSPGDDDVQFVQTGSNTVQISVSQFNGTPVNATYTVAGVTGQLVAYGDGGNDILDASGLLTVPATLDGGAGDNLILGGASNETLIGGTDGAEGGSGAPDGNNVIVAGNGNDTIYGNGLTARKNEVGGNNLIVGGSGNDVIYGNYGFGGDGGKGGQNLIVSGSGKSTIYTSGGVDGAEGGQGTVVVAGTTTPNVFALFDILEEWTSTDSLSTRLADIEGANGSAGLNGNNYLIPGITALPSSAVDMIIGDVNGAPNWLLYVPGQDTTSQLKTSDILTDLI